MADIIHKLRYIRDEIDTILEWQHTLLLDALNAIEEKDYELAVWKIKKAIATIGVTND